MMMKRDLDHHTDREDRNDDEEKHVSGAMHQHRTSVISITTTGSRDKRRDEAVAIRRGTIFFMSVQPCREGYDVFDGSRLGPATTPFLSSNIFCCKMLQTEDLMQLHIPTQGAWFLSSGASASRPACQPLQLRTLKLRITLT